MTDRLDELQRLHDAATKGEWFQDEEEPHWLIASHHLLLVAATFLWLGGRPTAAPQPRA